MNGMSWIDAPVSGGPPGAANGTLAVMAGGEATDIERAKPYVLVMAQRLTHMGPIGAGQMTKLCNQIIAGCAMVVLAEATRFAVDAGIDAARLPEALAGGFADSIPLQMFVPRMANRLDQPAIGAVSIILKDLDTIADVARAHATPVPMASLAAQMFRLLRSSRGPKADGTRNLQTCRPAAEVTVDCTANAQQNSPALIASAVFSVSQNIRSAG